MMRIIGGGRIDSRSSWACVALNCGRGMLECVDVDESLTMESIYASRRRFASLRRHTFNRVSLFFGDYFALISLFVTFTSDEFQPYLSS